MCSFTKKLQLLGDFVLQTPYRGSAPELRRGTSVPQTPSLLLCPPNNPVRSTPLSAVLVHGSVMQRVQPACSRTVN